MLSRQRTHQNWNPNMYVIKPLGVDMLFTVEILNRAHDTLSYRNITQDFTERAAMVRDVMSAIFVVRAFSENARTKNIPECASKCSGFN